MNRRTLLKGILATPLAVLAAPAVVNAATSTPPDQDVGTWPDPDRHVVDHYPLPVDEWAAHDTRQMNEWAGQTFRFPRYGELWQAQYTPAAVPAGLAPGTPLYVADENGLRLMVDDVTYVSQGEYLEWLKSENTNLLDRVDRWQEQATEAHRRANRESQRADELREAWTKLFAMNVRLKGQVDALMAERLHAGMTFPV